MNFNKIIFLLKDILDVSERRILLLFQSVFSLFKILILSNFNVTFPKTNEEECYVLGNGPSLKKVMLENEELLKRAVLICVNAFPTTSEYKLFKPRFGVFLDPLFFIGEYNSLLPHVRSTIEKLIEDTDWEFIMFIPTLAKRASYISDIAKKNNKVKIVYFNYTLVNGYSFLRHFFFKTNLGMPRCQNVLGASLFIALNLGFKKINLLGADHNLGKNIYVNDDNELCMIHEHFYSNGSPKITPVYRKPGGGDKMRISEFYTLCVKTFQTYYIIDEYAKYLKACIYNMTEGSFIDAFERKKLKRIKVIEEN